MRLGDDPGVDAPDDVVDVIDTPGKGKGKVCGEGLLLRPYLDPPLVVEAVVQWFGESGTGAMTLISSRLLPLLAPSFELPSYSPKAATAAVNTLGTAFSRGS